MSNSFAEKSSAVEIEVPPSRQHPGRGGQPHADFVGIGIAFDDHPGQDDPLIVLVGPLHRRHCDALPDALADRGLDFLPQEGAAKPLHLQPVFLAVDTEGAVDREDKREVDLVVLRPARAAEARR